MIWLIILAILFILLVGVALRPMKIPREPAREGKQEGDAVAAYYKASSWPVFAIERRIILREMIKDKPKGLILDIGSGPGFLAVALSNSFKDNTIVGLDINSQMVDIAEHRWPPASHGNLSFLVGDAQRLPFNDTSIDYIVSSLSLHHWENADRVFGEIHRVLKSGGRFIIFDLRRDGPRFFYYALKIGQALVAPRAIKETNGAVGSFWASYTSPEIQNILSKIPFQSWQIDNRFGWLLVRGHVKAKPV